MKKITILAFITFLLAGCNMKNNELFTKTDSFVDSLQSKYDSYGLFDVKENSIKTSDSLYAITPIGRLINVKILNPLAEAEYKELEEKLTEHYKGDKRVNDVYICQAGTIMIDCRDKE